MARLPGSTKGDHASRKRPTNVGKCPGCNRRLPLEVVTGAVRACRDCAMYVRKAWENRE